MTESLTKEERIQLSTQWPPDTRLFLKLLLVHDEMVAESAELNAGYDRMCLAVLCADEMMNKEKAKVQELESSLKACQDNAACLYGMTRDSRSAIIRHNADRLTAVECVEVIRSILK